MTASTPRTSLGTPGASFVVAFALGVLGLAGCTHADPAPWIEGTPLPARVLLDVRGRPQQRSLSCESRSACDLLAFWGCPVEEAEFLDGLARSDNPDRGFVGDVDDPGGGLPPHGYGVYEEPIARRLRAFGARAQAVRGVDLDWVKRQLAARRPVIVWATAGLDAPAAATMQDAEGRPFPVVPYEHTFLAVGYTRGKIVLLDPATGTTKKILNARFDASWAVLGRRAVVLSGASRPPP